MLFTPNSVFTEAEGDIVDFFLKDRDVRAKCQAFLESPMRLQNYYEKTVLVMQVCTRGTP